MKQENKDYLKRYSHNYETLKQADFIGHLELETRQELLRITREEFDPNYIMCITCTEDVFQLIKYVYGQAEKTDKEEALQKAHEERLEADKLPEVETNQNKPEETVALTKKATFPKQEKIK